MSNMPGLYIVRNVSCVIFSLYFLKLKVTLRNNITVVCMFHLIDCVCVCVCGRVGASSTYLREFSHALDRAGDRNIMYLASIIISKKWESLNYGSTYEYME